MKERRRYPRRILAAGFVMALPVALGVGVADSAPAPAAACATEGAIFNQPHQQASGGDETIHRHIVCLVDGTAAGAEIRVASYHFAHQEIKNALLRAYDRGVKVRVMVDRAVPGDSHDAPIYGELQKKLKSDFSKDSWVNHCQGAGPVTDGSDQACIGSVKMHNKLLLFSRTHSVDNVSFLTSSNLEDNKVAGNSGTDMWNSAYTATDAALYGHFHRYFDDLSGVDDGRWTDPADPDYYRNAALPKEYGKYTVYHSPRQEGSTALDVLSKVDCSGGTKVRAAMWNISGEKDGDPGSRIAQRLVELDNQGCEVDVVADVISNEPDGPLRDLLDGTGANNGPEVREFYSGRPHGVHEKNLLIEGGFAGRPNQKVVFTGSYNFTYRSVRVNDETWLRIADPAVHDSFLANFAQVRNAAHTCWQSAEAGGCGGGRVIDPNPTGSLNCHKTADKYLNAGYLYLYGADKCAGANDAKDNSGGDRDHGDNEGQVKNYDNQVNSLVNTTAKHVKFFNYPDYNEGHPEGHSFCVRPGQWVNSLLPYGDNQGSWENSISSHKLVEANECGRWLGGYHEPNRS
ncbi:phosphatidylserine/phosphatidylglycerophosphate/cardiolipin synthase family protein [Amycolatopsis sp. YIM 10]|uniref:phospholipase D-like domain-containing protein n=1 Tax=Amycolatopsis sp. YIM 10 TaxID=2653857 RepID=UPI0012904EF6|nr:phospholipase D-like domain-containing protein [Amycolatopsis sp. YIM 10]QFU90272.1 hypothetical protein YIM_25480 [Amycolatopsis sp. YIM 10]